MESKLSLVLTWSWTKSYSERDSEGPCRQTLAPARHLFIWLTHYILKWRYLTTVYTSMCVVWCCDEGYVWRDNRRESPRRSVRTPGRLSGTVLARNTPATADHPLHQYPWIQTESRSTQVAAEASVIECWKTTTGACSHTYVSAACNDTCLHRRNQHVPPTITWLNHASFNVVRAVVWHVAASGMDENGPSPKRPMQTKLQNGPYQPKRPKPKRPI